MARDNPQVRARTIQCLKGFAELQVAPTHRPDHVCFSLHGPRGGFVGNFWFEGQSLVDLVAELGFSAGQEPTLRSGVVEAVLAKIDKVHYVQTPRSLGERILFLVHALGAVAGMVVGGNLRRVKEGLGLVAAMAMAAMMTPELNS